MTPNILHLLEFQLAKLVKIRKDQNNLPIFQYKEKIIEAVKSYPVIVVAGDTGCGKSTQVRAVTVKSAEGRGEEKFGEGHPANFDGGCGGGGGGHIRSVDCTCL